MFGPLITLHSGVLELLVGVLHLAIALVVSGHIVLTKSDVRSAIGWTGLVWLTPFVGSLLYLSFGVNRIRRRAGRMRRRPSSDDHQSRPVTPAPIGAALSPEYPPAARSLAALVGAVTGTELTAGNSIEPLLNGDEAYPSMVAAIDAATRSVALATYIFDHGRAADEFVDALARAVGRGVAVRVLIDSVGARYSRPPIVGTLRGKGVTVARFLPSMFPVPHPYVNLRNHRKLLVADGTVGFCGGLNIRDGCVLALGAPPPTRDVHFRIQGPVVRQLMSAFAFDWLFTTREKLAGDAWFPALDSVGGVFARGIADGPDEDFETLRMTLLGAVSQATRTIRVATPYFLPDAPLIDALRVAALRGVRVDIVLPERGNLRLVQWAATAQLDQVVGAGCHVYLSRPPFDHSKLLVIDGLWSLIGSANWDPRSLRLNFEYVVECYSAEFSAQTNAMIDSKLVGARLLSLADLQGRSLPVKLRDGIAWLAQPYL